MKKDLKQSTVLVQINFSSPEPESKLRTIELYGVPAQFKDGKYTVNKNIQQFFKDLILRDLFQGSLNLPNCDFARLKIWLDDEKGKYEKIEYEIPMIDDHDFLLPSNNPISKLKKIYVLDNELEGKEYEYWKENAEKLFSPLFGNFIAPLEKPEIVANAMESDNSFTKFLSSLVKTLESKSKEIDPYLEIKQKLFFDALIIQID
ncbi:hypothetical protein ACL6C3_27420 [Capilliphycus salinus ALCB114379]|uniref:hypothetical protein n=1 Tax=Capilliphycus salinus TaxID=2768948 RepID=UPI0039A64D1A